MGAKILEALKTPQIVFDDWLFLSHLLFSSTVKSGILVYEKKKGGSTALLHG